MKSLSNVIKAAQFRAEQAEKKEKIMIDSNPRADLFLSGLHKKLEASAVSEQVEEGNAVLSAEVEDAIREQAALILERAREEERHIKEQALKEAKIQKNQILEEARESGYREGYESGVAALKEMEDKLKERMALNQQEFVKQVKELEPLFTDLVIRYTEKLTGHLLEEKRPVIGYLMKQAVLHADSGKVYVVHVSPEEYEMALEQEDELRKLVSSRASLEVLSDSSLKCGECKLETENCVIDSGMGTRLEILKENLRLLEESRESV